MAAELAFLKQQHVILSLENKALVQRITCIAHEKQIKDSKFLFYLFRYHLVFYDL